MPYYSLNLHVSGRVIKWGFWTLADWGDKRRRPCIVSFTPTWKGTNGPVILTKGVIRRNYMKPERYKAILGSFENFSEILYCPRYYAY